jgi:hypothetical protein
MGNTLLTVDEITAEAQRVLHNELQFVKNIDKQHDKDTTYGGQKRGASIRIRKPPQFTVRTGWPINVQDVVEEYDTLTVGTPLGIDVAFSDAELSQNLNDFSKNFITPAMKTLASKVDYNVFSGCYKSVYQLVGTTTVTPASALVYLQAGQKLNDSAAGTSDRKMIIDPGAEVATINALTGIVNPASTIGKQYTSGSMGSAFGFNFMMSQNVPTHTCGTRTNTTPLVATAPSNGATSLALKGAGTSVTFKAGDVFTIGVINTATAVYSINPETKQSNQSLQQFVVTDDITGESDGTVTLAISPAIRFSALGRQNVDKVPAVNAEIVWYGAASNVARQNMAFLPEAFTFATAKLEMPSDVNFKAQMVVDGISLRVLRQYDINNANYPCRIDVYYGYLCQRPQLACRVSA